MIQKDLMEFLAIWEKLQIETNPNLTQAAKKLCKSFIDAIKNEATKQFQVCCLKKHTPAF